MCSILNSDSWMLFFYLHYSNIYVTIYNMKWHIEYYSSDVEKSVLDLPDGLLARSIKELKLATSRLKEVKNNEA